jgi:hypothetical protein
MPNIIAPTTAVGDRLTPLYVVRTTEVRIDLSECFEIKERGQTLYGLGKPALDKIAQAGGISFDPALSGVVGKPSEDYLMFRAVANMTLPDGTKTTGIGTVEWMKNREYDPIAAELEDAKATYAANKTDQNRKMVYGKTKQLADIMRYRVPMVESKAMNRAVRRLMGLKAKYTKAELAEPFVVPHIEYMPDLADRNVMELLKSGADGRANALYGATADVSFDRPALPSGSDDEDFEDVPWSELKAQAEADDAAEEVEAELVEDEEESFDAEVPAGPLPTSDPAMYVVTDARSSYKDQTLLEVEGAHPGYCEFIVGKAKGSQELQDACRDYLVSYKPESDVL